MDITNARPAGRLTARLLERGDGVEVESHPSGAGNHVSVYICSATDNVERVELGARAWSALWTEWQNGPRL